MFQCWLALLGRKFCLEIFFPNLSQSKSHLYYINSYFNQKCTVAAKPLMVKVCDENQNSLYVRSFHRTQRGYLFFFRGNRIMQLCNVSGNEVECGQVQLHSNPQMLGHVKKYKLPIVLCCLIPVMLSWIQAWLYTRIKQYKSTKLYIKNKNKATS